jgi:predicted RNase H-like nuclease (RuvC/YqgF family)
MKYKNFLLNTTQRNRENIQQKNTRQIEYIYARKIYYKILDVTTKMSYKSMGATLGQTHATVIHALNNFKWDYEHNNAFKEAYNRVYHLYAKKETVLTLETLTHENQVLTETISTLKKKIEELRGEVKQTRSNNIKPRNQQHFNYARYNNVQGRRMRG